MIAQVPIMVFFVIKWLRRAPGQTVRMLALQVGTALAAVAPVFFIGL
jgi:hypothetical protein